MRRRLNEVSEAECARGRLVAGVCCVQHAASRLPGGSAAPGGKRRAPSSAAPSADTSKGTVKFAIELPQQGSEKAASDPIINGIKLAVKDAGGGAGGYKIEIPNGSIFDDALNGVHDPQTGAAT